MNDDTRYIDRWRKTSLIAAAVIVLVVPLYALKESLVRSGREADASQAASFVGREKCIDCHRDAYEAWLGSDHDNAMAVANDTTVLGDFDDATFAYGDISARFYKRDGGFFVHTQGPGGEPGDFEIAYTFGLTPLQQYLIPFPGGRLQALTIAWDTEREEWFYLYPGQDIPPDDWLHWTRNAQNWNGMCAECHSTNLIKNYDHESQSFSTTWSEIDVSCEACHGPGSRHVEWAKVPPMARPVRENYELVIDTGDIDSRQQVELCAPCHSRRTELGDYDHTRADLLDNIVPAILEEELYFADGQIRDEVYVYGSFVQSKMFKNDIRCSDCHDVHSLKLVEEGNELCLQCHRAEAYDSYDHHFHKREHEGKPSDGHLCVKCHMPESPYMVVDWRADHSLRVPRPDLALEIGVPNACNQGGCHDDRAAGWSAEHFRKWYGIARKPHYGTVIAAGRKRDPGAQAPLIDLAGNDLYPAIVRATALSLLGAYPGDVTTAAFNRALADDEALVRYTAVTNVTSSSAETHMQLIAPLLFDPVRAVRMQAAVHLAGFPDEMLEPYQRQAIQETLAEYEKAMEYALDFAFAGHNLGNLYSRLGKPELAEQYYKAAIAIDDLFYPAKANLAILYNTQRRNEEAERLLQEILDSFPEQYEAAYSLGLLLAEMNRYEKATEYLELAARGMPDYPRVFYNLGLVQQQLGRDAEPALIRAVELEPGNLNFLYALADFYVSQDELRKAMYVAEQMVAAHPQSQAAHDIRKYIEQQLVAPGR